MDRDVDEAPLNQYLAVLWRRRGWVVLGLALVVGLAYVLTSRQSTVYAASGQILIRSESNVSLFPAGSDRDHELLRSPGAELLYVDSADFRRTVREQLATPASVSASLEPIDFEVDYFRRSSGLMNLRGTSATASGAADAVNVFAETYIARRHADDQAQVAGRIEDVAGRLDSAVTKRATLVAPLAALDAEISVAQQEALARLLEARAEDATELDAQIAQAQEDAVAELVRRRTQLGQDLSSEVSAADREISSLETELAELSTLQRIVEDPNSAARVSFAAGVPSSPVSPKPVRSLLVGTFAGLMFGVALAFLRENFDGSLGTPDEAARTLDLTPLGAVADVPDLRGKRSPRKRAAKMARMKHEESARAIRTAIRFASSADHPDTVFAVTSANASEGKTFVSLSLAGSFADAGESVLLVDCDFPRPSLHERVGLANGVGLATLIRGEATFDDVIHHSAFRGVDLVTSGPVMSASGSPFTSERFQLFLKEATARYHAVVLDCAPVLPVADARVVASAADGVVFVASAATTKRKEALRALDHLENSRATVLGLVMNRVDGSARDYYYGSYG